MRQIKCPMCQSKVDVSSEAEVREIICPACGENIRLDAIAPEAPAVVVPEPNRYEVRRYEAGSGGGRVFGLIATVFLGLFTTLVVTVLVGVIGSFFWLIMIFPILHGFG